MTFPEYTLSCSLPNMVLDKPNTVVSIKDSIWSILSMYVKEVGFAHWIGKGRAEGLFNLDIVS